MVTPRPPKGSGSRAPLIPLGLLAVMVQFIVVVEEEHLERTFGEDYLAFKRTRPRYVGFVQKRADAA